MEPLGDSSCSRILQNYKQITMEVPVFTAQETAEELFLCACNCAHGHLYVFMYRVSVSAFVSSGTWSVEARGWCQVSSLITFHFRFRTGLLQTQVSQILFDSLPIKALGSPPFPSPDLSWSQSTEGHHHTWIFIVGMVFLSKSPGCWVSPIPMMAKV